MKKRANVDSRSSGADEGWAVMTTLIGGFVVWGGIGWLMDRWLGTRLFTPIGLIVGMALGIYAVVARYGRPERANRDEQSASTATPTAPPATRSVSSDAPPAHPRRESA
jgi:F0F1-type ATP synthase assembly protein I